MNRRTVLVVEDDERLRLTIEDYLTMNDYKVITSEAGTDAVRIFETVKDEISIVVLDGMLPEMDGYDVLKHIRKSSDVPVIMLSARESEEDQLTGYALGANNYMTKPFLLSVLKAQIDAFLRKPEDRNLQKGALRVDTGARRFYLNDTEMETTPKEYDVLLYLMINEQIVLDRNAILDHVWGQDYSGTDRTVDSIIKQLRKKMTPDYPYIKSVYGVGYYFEVTENDS